MNIVLLSAKYLILLFFALFVFASFRAQRDVPDEFKRSSFQMQKTCIFLMHALSFLCIILHAITDELSFTYEKALIFYAGQLLYLIIMTSVIPAVVSLNKGLNNIMCMFLAISMVVQTRLNFSASVRQFWMLLASTVIFLIFVFFCKRTSFLHKLTWLYCIAGLGLLSSVLVLATVTKGAKLSIELFGYSVQPMEFVKIVFVLFVAAAFNKARTFKTVLITAIFAALHIIILVFCRDLGSALILFAIYVFMLFVATRRGIYLLIGAGAFAAASVIAYKLFSHVRVRISVWLDPWADINDKGYQITQALFAIGTGGWFGAGIFGGSPGYVPEVSNDMVFAAISEEFGGIFALLLIFLCICFVLMIMRVSIRLEYRFYKLLAFGLGIAYIFQVFLNIGGTMKFIPLTGVNLPFISSGGSSLLSSMIMVGIVQALYVISEADVERERIALANGVDITEFYQENSEDFKERKEKKEKRRKKKHGRYAPEDGRYEEYEEEYGVPPEEDDGEYYIYEDHGHDRGDWIPYDQENPGVDDYEDPHFYEEYYDPEDYDPEDYEPEDYEPEDYDPEDDVEDRDPYYDYEDPDAYFDDRGNPFAYEEKPRVRVVPLKTYEEKKRDAERTKVFGQLIYGEEKDGLSGGYDRYSEEYQVRQGKKRKRYDDTEDLTGGYNRYSPEYYEGRSGRYESAKKRKKTK